MRRSRQISNAVITCQPVRPLSNRFILTGLYGEISVTLNPFSENGAIVIDGKRFNVTKFGPTSGFWAVEDNGVIVVSAEKASAVKRRFEIRNEAELLHVRARSVFTRSFELLQNDIVIGRITPDSPFTRRSTIALGDTSLDQLTVAFAFWLCTVSWRRAQG